MLTRIAVLIAAAIATVATAPQAQGTPPRDLPLRIATEGAFPPYNALTKDGRLIGYEIELGDAICAHLSLRCTWVITDWPGMPDRLLKGEVDLIMAGMAITPSRAKRMAFSLPYTLKTETNTGLYVGANSFIDPKTARIAVQKGTIHEDHLIAQGRRVIPFTTMGAALKAVLDGKADLVFGSHEFLRSKVTRTSRSLTIIGEEEIMALGAAIAFRPSGTALRDRFNAALRALDKDGTLTRLNRKWFPLGQDI